MTLWCSFNNPPPTISKRREAYCVWQEGLTRATECLAGDESGEVWEVRTVCSLMQTGPVLRVTKRRRGNIQEQGSRNIGNQLLFLETQKDREKRGSRIFYSQEMQTL